MKLKHAVTKRQKSPLRKNRLLLLTSDVRTLVQSGPDQSELYEVCCDGAVCKHRCYLLLL